MTSNDTTASRNANNARISKIRDLLSAREMGVYYSLLILVVLLSFATSYMGRPSYLSALNITNVLYQSSLVSIMAVGMTIVLITGNIDLSVASLAALSAAVMVALCDHIGFAGASIVALFIAAACGLLNGLIVQYLKVNAFITTLGTMTALRGIVLVLSDGRSISANTSEARLAMQVVESSRVGVGHVFLTLAFLLAIVAFIVAVYAKNNPGHVRRHVVVIAAVLVAMLIAGLAVPAQATVAIPVIYAGTIALIAWFITTYTVLGRRLYAVGGNAEAARLSGINIRAYKIGGFVLCSIMACIAGILFGCRLSSVNPNALQGAELTVIAATIIGGTSLFGGAGSVVKSVAGSILLFTLTNGFNILNLGANSQGIVEGVVIIAAAAVYTLGESRSRKVVD